MYTLHFMWRDPFIGTEEEPFENNRGQLQTYDLVDWTPCGNGPRGNIDGMGLGQYETLIILT